jgi:hypothetical protein
MTNTITRRRIGLSVLATLAAPAILRHPAAAAGDVPPRVEFGRAA